MMNNLNCVFFENKQSLDNNLNSLLKHRLGYGVFISRTVDCETGGIDKILGVYIPRIIDDCKTGNRVIKFLRFDSVGLLEIKHSDNGFKLFLPSIEELNAKLTNKMSNLVFSVESSLLQNTYQRLVEIPVINNSLNPIREILIQLYDNNVINFYDFLKYREERKVLAYVSFLENLELVRRDGNNIIAGNRFTLMEEMLKKEDERKIYDTLLADVLRNGFDYIREYFKLTSLTPYIRWSTSYYLPSIQSRTCLSLNQNALMNHYYQIYQIKPKEGKISNQISHLVRVGILNKEDNFITGNKDIIDKLSPIMTKAI